MEQVAELLRELAAGLGTTTEYLWPLLVKQQQVEVFLHAVWCVVGFIVMVAGLRVYLGPVKRLYAMGSSSRTSDEDDALAFSVGAALVFVVVGTILFLGTGYEVVSHVIVPEAEALSYLIGLIH